MHVLVDRIACLHWCSHAHWDVRTKDICLTGIFRRLSKQPSLGSANTRMCIWESSWIKSLLFSVKVHANEKRFCNREALRTADLLKQKGLATWQTSSTFNVLPHWTKKGKAHPALSWPSEAKILKRCKDIKLLCVFSDRSLYHLPDCFLPLPVKPFVTCLYSVLSWQILVYRFCCHLFLVQSTHLLKLNISC